ncbi:MAG: alpha/beta hydrolase [Halieaceae bacterium]|jgi:haloalkane dehalogenase|nr:alpha/beta hydrolase [Halieaceae bacterium]RPG89510.1 MAG: alpha/beta fold hydrolase [Cellvibrionales bacterium TMED157]
MIPASETFKGTWPFKPHFTYAAGFRQHYVDEGPSDGEAILCLHGEPTWGYLYRKMIGPLSEKFRVVVPDHMGFGKSETPQDRVYTLQSHVENLEQFVADLDLSDITIVCQDWGGPIAGAFTARNPGLVKRLFLANTVLGYGGGQSAGGKTPWFQWIEKHEEAGTLNGILGELGSTVLSVMKIIGFQNTAAVDDTWIEAYSAPFPDRESCIGAINFPLDVHYGRFLPFVFETMATGDIAALKSKPAMLVSGDKDFGIAPDHAISDFRGLFPDASVVEMSGVGHFCQEDIPDELVQFISDFIRDNP